MSILPPFSIFRHAHDGLMELHTRKQLLEYGRNLQDRADRLEEHIQRIQFSTAYRENITLELFPADTIKLSLDTTYPLKSTLSTARDVHLTDNLHAHEVVGLSAKHCTTPAKRKKK